jgi:hypothetical protein
VHRQRGYPERSLLVRGNDDFIDYLGEVERVHLNPEKA